MDSVYCTLYNSKYLDKGLVLYDSLCKCVGAFKLYVLCMDDKCFEVLCSLKQPNHIPIKLEDFESGDDELVKAKGNRTIGEYCWTCTSSFILYILRRFNHEICTYIDADMYFYSNPQVLIDEMLAARKSVIVVPHRFPKEKLEEEKIVGKYCVEFNTFMNNKDGLEVLHYWRNRCIENCGQVQDGIHWGDQKYLEEFEEHYDCIHVCSNLGAGVAPWNIGQYKDYNKNSNTLFSLADKRVNLIFLHFASIFYITNTIINTTIQVRKGLDYALVNNIYKDYLIKLSEKKLLLKESFGLDILIKRHPAAKGKRTIKQRISSSYLLAVLRAKFHLYNLGHSYYVSL